MCAVTSCFRQLSENERLRRVVVPDDGVEPPLLRSERSVVTVGPIRIRIQRVGLDGIEPSPHGVRIRHAASEHLKPVVVAHGIEP